MDTSGRFKRQVDQTLQERNRKSIFPSRAVGESASYFRRRFQSRPFVPALSTTLSCQSCVGQVLAPSPARQDSPDISGHGISVIPFSWVRLLPQVPKFSPPV